MRFPENQISHRAERYTYEPDDRPNNVGAYARSHGCLDVENLFEICDWKSRRRSENARLNRQLSTKEITRFSFTTWDELSKIRSLTLLNGVEWPTASVILHFCVNERYPILDGRAIWSLGEEKPSYYDFDFWWSYVCTCREIADQNNVLVRYLDKALWQYSQENQ